MQDVVDIRRVGGEDVCVLMRDVYARGYRWCLCTIKPVNRQSVFATSEV